MPDKLTPKQKKFADAVLSGESYKDAARIAGYSGDDNYLSRVGSENVRKCKIQDYMTKVSEDNPLIWGRKERQEFWTRIAQGKELDGDTMPAMRDRIKASELLGKTQGDFIDRVEHSGPDGKAIQVESSPEERRARIAELTAMLGVLDDDDA